MRKVQRINAHVSHGRQPPPGQCSAASRKLLREQTWQQKRPTGQDRQQTRDHVAKGAPAIVRLSIVVANCCRDIESTAEDVMKIQPFGEARRLDPRHHCAASFVPLPGRRRCRRPRRHLPFGPGQTSYRGRGRIEYCRSQAQSSRDCPASICRIDDRQSTLSADPSAVDESGRREQVGGTWSSPRMLRRDRIHSLGRLSHRNPQVGPEFFGKIAAHPGVDGALLAGEGRSLVERERCCIQMPG